MKIAVLPENFGECEAALNKLRGTGFRLWVNPLPRPLREDEVGEVLDGAAGVIAGTEPLGSDVLRGAAALRVISRLGTGLDNVDLRAAAQLGIQIFTTPDAATQAVAELALGLILSLLRRIPEADRAVRARSWSPLMGSLLLGKTLGVVGLGRSGKRLVNLVEPLWVTVLAADPHPDHAFAQSHAVKIAPLAQVLETADVISLHLPLTGTTRLLIGARELALMKPSAVVVNTSRGAVIDEAALASALEEGRIAGAGLDVYQREPYDGPLAGLENVVLTAHMGSYAREARRQMELEAVENLLRGLGSSFALGGIGGSRFTGEQQAEEV